MVLVAIVRGRAASFTDNRALIQGVTPDRVGRENPDLRPCEKCWVALPETDRLNRWRNRKDPHISTAMGMGSGTRPVSITEETVVIDPVPPSLSLDSEVVQDPANRTYSETHKVSAPTANREFVPDEICCANRSEAVVVVVPITPEIKREARVHIPGKLLTRSVIRLAVLRAQLTNEVAVSQLRNASV